jgi:hypothetical protein
MLKLSKDFVLTSAEETIKSSTSFLRLRSEFEGAFFAVVILNNQRMITVPLDKEGEIYKGKLFVTKPLLPFLPGAKVKVNFVNEQFSKESTSVDLIFDMEKVQLDIKKDSDKDIRDLLEKVLKLESELKTYVKKGVLKDTTVINKEEIKEGMIPVALKSGEFAAAYPFDNVVKVINGVEAKNEAIILSLQDIPFEESGKNSKEVVQLLLEASRSQSEAIKKLLDLQLKMLNEIEELKLKLAKHINTALF